MANKSFDTRIATSLLMFPFGSMNLVRMAPQDSGLVLDRGVFNDKRKEQEVEKEQEKWFNVILKN